MESRKITIISSKNQQKYVIMSGAETLGQLKQDLDNNSIDYLGMTFMEGITKSEFNNNAAILPKDVEYRGNITNELVFMLTQSEKKIKSGNCADRYSLYSKIKEYNLQSYIKEVFGKNFTQLKTVELEEVIKEYENSNKSTSKDEASGVSVNSTEIESNNIDAILKNLEYRLSAVENRVFDEKPLKSSYSDTELESMFM